MRSTSPGRLSSSQDFSIGRSISLTRSSSVRALLLSTVWASVLKADSTADTVECDRIACAGIACGGVSKAGGGPNERCRWTARAAAASVNSRSSCGSTLRNEDCCGGAVGTAISSVSSNTSPSGWEGRISSADVASSRPDSNASISSWLLLAASAGDGGAAGGGEGGGGAGAFAALADGGTSVITDGFGAGGGAAGFSSLTGAADAAGLDG